MDNINVKKADIKIDDVYANKSTDVKVEKVTNANGQEIEEINLTPDTGQGVTNDGSNITTPYDEYLKLPDTKMDIDSETKKIDVTTLGRDNDYESMLGSNRTNAYPGTLEFDTVKVVDGETCYYDKNDNLIKKINKDGSVSIFNVAAKTNMGNVKTFAEVRIEKDGTIKYMNNENTYIVELKNGNYLVYSYENGSTKTIYSVQSNRYDVYDESGRVIARQYKDGTKIEYNYDIYGKVITVTKDGTKIAEYDSKGNIIYKATDENHGVSFDDKGNATGTVTKENGVETTVYKDGSKHVFDSANKTSTDYDTKGNMTFKSVTTSDGKNIDTWYENGKVSSVSGTYANNTDKGRYVETNSQGETITTDQNGNVLQKEDTNGITLYNSDGSASLRVNNDGSYTIY